MIPRDPRIGAEFSPCRQYRYRLWRQWNAERAKALFVLLNPSMADETQNDPTVERCERRARMWGYGGVEVVNLFAYRSTDPKVLYRVSEPIGMMNDEAILIATIDAGIVICGWGEHGAHLRRGQAVLDLLSSDGTMLTKIYHLGLNASGQPKHPLYISYRVLPMRFN